MFEKVELWLSDTKKTHLIAAGALFFILVFFTFRFWIGSHIVYGDLSFGFVLDGYIDKIFPLWSEKWSTATFFNGTRLPFAGLLYWIIWLFGDFPSFFEKALIFLLLYGSGFGMFFLLWWIITQKNISERVLLGKTSLFIIALSGAIYYAFNPWNIIRIQHIYLLVGYACLPFVFAYMLRFTHFSEQSWEDIDERPSIFHISRTDMAMIILAALFYAIWVGAVHYLFFSAFFVGGWYVFQCILDIFKKRYWHIGWLTWRYVVFGILTLLFLAYWLVPYLGASRIASVNPPSINTIDSISNFSRYSTFRYVLYLVSYWWPIKDLDSLPWYFWFGGTISLVIIFLWNIIHFKKPLIFFFLGFSVVFTILSTGTNTPYFADMYRWIVFDNPFAGQAGFIFRDPNKLVGLLAFCFSILWSTGLVSLLRLVVGYLRDRTKQIDFLKRASQVFDGRKTSYWNWYRVGFLSFLLLASCSYFAYLYPFYNTYFEQFYRPVDTPQTYKDFVKWQKDAPTPDGKIWYFPRYESWITPGYGFGLTTWTKDDKFYHPTSSYDLYTTQFPTYNPLEWSIPFLDQTYQYVAKYLSNWVGENLAKYFELFHVSRFWYHKDLLWQEDIQAIQNKNIRAQKGFEIEKKIGFYDIFHIKDTLPYSHAFSRSVWIFDGISTLETLFGWEKYPYRTFANLFVTEDPIINTLNEKSVKKDDIIIGSVVSDMILSKSDKNDWFVPFDFCDFSNPFSRFAKLRVDAPDWKFHLGKLGIKNWTWDFDYNRGFIFSYAPAMLDLEPYEYLHDKGKDILGFKTMEDISDFFLPESASGSNISVALEKTNRYASLPAIKWEIPQGESPIWQVWRTRKIMVKEKNAYVFELVASGKGVDKIHGKVKFFDGNNKEIGLDYVSAPRYAESFDLLKFSGNFITPVGAKYLTFEMGSMEKPENRSYWWIHDMVLKDMHEYVKPNTIYGTFDFASPWKYVVVARVFRNEKWGKVKISVGDKKILVDTKTGDTNKFVAWNVGVIDIQTVGKRQIWIENIDGFNAINVVGFIPESRYKTLVDEIYSLPARQMIVGEAENDFEFLGNIQDDIFSADFSNGKTVRLNDGKMSSWFDVIHDGKYSLRVKLANRYYPKDTNLHIKLVFWNQVKELFPKNAILEGNTLFFRDIELRKWTYELRVWLYDLRPSLVNAWDFRRFSSQIDGDAEKPSTEVLIDEPGCSYHAWLWDESVRYWRWGLNQKIELSPGFSCFWLVSTHTMVPIAAEVPYLFQYKIIHENTKRLHMKLRFLDAQRKMIEVRNIIEYTEKWKDFYESIFRAPKGAVYVQVQFWQKQLQDVVSIWDLSSVVLKRYNAIQGLDAFIIKDESITFDSPKISSSVLDAHNPNPMNRTVTSTGLSESHWILQMAETFTLLWQRIMEDGTMQKPRIVNIFLNGYDLDGSQWEKVSLRYVPEKFLAPGISLTLITLFSAIYFMFIRGKERKIMEILKRKTRK